MEKVAEIDTEEIEQMIMEINGFDQEAGSIGGDTSTILPHIQAMKDAGSSNDRNMFDQYYQISKDWFAKFLVTLYPPAINGMINEIKDLEKSYVDIGKQDRLNDKVPDLGGIMETQGSEDLDILRTTYQDLKSCLEKINTDRISLSDELVSEVKGSIKELKKITAKIIDDEKRGDLENRIGDMVTLSNTDPMRAYSHMSSISRDLQEETSKVEIGKFEKILMSVEPLISRVAEFTEGKDDQHLELIKEKDRLRSLFSTDIQEAMKGMELLLESSAMKAAELEENAVLELEGRIDKLNSDIEQIKDLVDVSPIENILKKASNMVESNVLKNVDTLLDKADDVLVKIKEKKATEEARNSLDGILNTRKELVELSIDVNPLDGPLEVAKNALENGDLLSFEEQLGILKERISSMKKEEKKVEYQKLLITIMNEIRGIKEDGIDTTPYEKELEKIKESFLARDTDGSVEMERKLLRKLRRMKLSDVLSVRIEKTSATLQEAEGLLIETNKANSMINEAKELMRSDHLEEALDLFTLAQVDLEDRMTKRTFSLVEKEIRRSMEECSEYSIDLENPEDSIHEAYNLADDDMFKEGMEHLYGLRESIANKLMNKKASVYLEELSNLIKQARSLGLKIASFKASHTRAKVLIEAGDLESGLDLVERQLKIIKESISNRKELRSTLDSIRGRLIGFETQIKRMTDSGVEVDDLKETISRITELINNSEADEANTEMQLLGKKIDSRSTGTRPKEVEPTVTRSFFRESTRADKVEEEIDPETAKSKLFSLVGDIRLEMKERSIQGKDTGSIKRDIESIQNLVIRKEYVKAYKVARSCLDSIKL